MTRARRAFAPLLALLVLASSCSREQSLPDNQPPPRILKPGESLPADYQSIDSLLDLTQRTLAFVELQRPLPQARERLKGVEAAIEAGNHSEQLLGDLRRLRRQILFQHPALDFDRLLINQRPPPNFEHQSDQYLGRHSGVGTGLVILDSWKDSPQKTRLLHDKLPPGSVLHPDLSFDGQQILFSYCDHTQANPKLRRFFVWQIHVDGTGLKQLTGTQSDPLLGLESRQTALIEDWDPCYLPDGGFAFISTRNQGGVRCHNGRRYCPTYTLFRANANGGSIRPLSYGEANEWDPSVLSDGRLVWTRWDYINRHENLYQSLWSIYPDGSATSHLYGNYTENPCVIAEARTIPGSHRLVATASAHHMYTAGSIIMIDPRQGRDGPQPLTRITPEIAFPETETHPPTATDRSENASEDPQYPQAAFATPWPLSEDLFLAAYSPAYWAETNSYAIYLIDTLGGRELIYQDPAMSCFSPIPLQPRPAPPTLPSKLSPEPRTATGQFYIGNVYESPHRIPAGSVKALRIVQVLPQPTQNAPGRSINRYELPKRIVGTVPVSPNGSVFFEAPAQTPLLFQLLDQNGMCIMGMRTFVYLHPGERQSCVGCHETAGLAPPDLAPPQAAPLLQPLPPRGPQYDGGLSFVKTVQPVLDRHCIRCHGLDTPPAADLNLLGNLDPESTRFAAIRANQAYHSLVSRTGLVSIAWRNAETATSAPMDYYAHAGRLASLLLNGDKDHQPLDSESLERVVNWLDLNAQFYGDYSWNKDEWRATSSAGEAALRQHVRETFGNDLAQQPLAALINVGLPSESRILKGPLAVEAGGWGQFTNGWQTLQDPGYHQMRQRVEACILPTTADDSAGTCNQTTCVCRSCWIRDLQRPQSSESANRPRPGTDPR